MSAAAAAAKKKKQKSNVKKKNQEQWDELTRFIRTLSRESLLPIGQESNFVIKLFEEYADDNAPFPPKQMIVSRIVDNPVWMKILMTALVSKQCATYTNLFTTKSYKGLKGLCFWGCDIGDEGTKYICEALPLLPLCCKLELMDCGLGVTACEHLGVSLKHRRTTHLKILRLDHNPNIGAQGVARLSEGMYFNSLLHTLSLNYCGIKKDGGIFLQNILMTRDIGLQTFNLEGNSLERDGVIALAQGLASNRTLTALNIAQNSFGGEGDKIPGELDAIKYLTIGFASCTTLKNINMGGNLVGNLGLEVLYQATLANQLNHLQEFEFTPFVESEIYKNLVDKIELNKPVKVKKKKKRKSTKKK